MSRRLKVFTWHVHGSYLYYLSKGNFDIYIPVKDRQEEGYHGRGKTFPFGRNVIEVPVNEVRDLDFDCILFQTAQNYLTDQYQVLNQAQRQLPQIFVQHDPPWKHPTNEVHVVRDPAVVMVHVTHFNRLMWKNASHIVKVIEHGVIEPDAKYIGDIPRGIVVINHLHQRGRMLGADIYDDLSSRLSIDLIGMGTKEFGGLGEVLHPMIPEFISHYRFFFNPIRYTSFGLAVCEAMMAGIPVVALATTEYASVIKDGINGYISNDINYLERKMKELLDDPLLAGRIGEEGAKTAREKFNIKRFTSEWEDVFRIAITNHHHHETKKSSVYQ